MPRCPSPETGTMETGEACSEGMIIPIDVPTTAPPAASVMKCMPPRTRAVATKVAIAPPTPNTIHVAFEWGCSRRMVTSVDVAIAKLMAA